ncbi:MAG: hypothetical protein AMJ65_10585 [Phycisphaerae bacterium SG8_4]|nr:MAG: hypothetical protein AMJ65_10585 [Phycisphaerae bacterium SG8_4]
MQFVDNFRILLITPVILLHLFAKQLNCQGKLVKTMSAGACPAQIIHAPVALLLILPIRNVSLYTLRKSALAGLNCVLTRFVLGHTIKKLPLARRIR